MMELSLHRMYRIFLLLLNIISNVECSLTVVRYVQMNTKFASLIGTVETVSVPAFNNGQYRKETSYIAMRGIPYAEAPVRWQDPIIKEPFPEGTLLNATVDKSPCSQWITKNGTSVLLGSEDCLFASIFIPIVKHTSKSKRVPMKIMIFFHGGGFMVNSNRNMLPIPLLAQENCMIVMFNYRVSIFGYLSTGTSSLPGNYAFLDQITLLKWIQLYGRDFGGDTNDVTIFGSSIGSVSIHYLLFSKLATGFFHSAILESGSAFCERSLVPNPLDISTKLGSKVGCRQTIQSPPQKLVECLRSKSTMELMMGAKSLTTEWVLPSVLGPVIDKYSRPPNCQFLPDYPENLPIANKVPVIAGITKDEGLTALVKLSKQFDWEQFHNVASIQNLILPHYLNLIMRWRRVSSSQRHNFIENLSQETMQFYWDDFAKDPIQTLVDILGDLWINVCHRKTLEHLCINAVPSVHAYLFTHHETGISPSEIDKDIQEFHASGKNHIILDKGVAHTEEILYILEEELEIMSPNGSRLTKSPRNKLMADSLSHLWTSFANSRLLNYPTRSGWPNWLPVCTTTSKNYTYLNPGYPLYEISLDNHRLMSNYRLKEVQFWWRKHQDSLQY